jgi:hypothetical protein
MKNLVTRSNLQEARLSTALEAISFTLKDELVAFSARRSVPYAHRLATAAVAADTLYDMLKTNANAPSSTDVAVIPASGITTEMLQQLQDVMMLL